MHLVLLYLKRLRVNYSPSLLVCPVGVWREIETYTGHIPWKGNDWCHHRFSQLIWMQFTEQKQKEYQMPCLRMHNYSLITTSRFPLELCWIYIKARYTFCTSSYQVTTKFKFCQIYWHDKKTVTWLILKIKTEYEMKVNATYKNL